MIAVGLSGLLLSMAVPSFDIFFSNALQTGEFKDLGCKIHQGRSTAVTKNTRVTFCESD